MAKAEALAWRLIGTGSAIVATIAARKLLTFAYEKGAGKNPPTNPESPETTVREAIVWALVSGATVGVARLLATRQVANYWRRSTGHLPPGLEEVVA